MSGMGFKYQEWTKQLDTKLLENVSAGEDIETLSMRMKMSEGSIYKRLKQMGFIGLKDARKELASRKKHML
jgi:hypothetical protein